MHAALIPDRRELEDPRGRCVDGAGLRLDNAQFAERVRAASARLAGLGVGRGTVVAVILPNRVEFAVALFAAWRLGAVVTPLNPALTADECAYQLADSGTVLAVADAERADRIRAAVPVVLDPADLDGGPGSAPEPVADLDDLALLVYTSGTTGRPKGVMLGHDNIAAMVRIWIDWLTVTTADRCLLILPLFHVNGIMVSLVGPLAAGASVVIGDRFAAERFWSQVERERPTYFSAVPTILTALCELPDATTPDTSSLRFVACGAAPATAALLRAFEERYLAPVIEGYGLTECTLAATINPLGDGRKAGTVGRPLDGVEVSVLDARGAILPAGGRGEVAIRGATVMRGYLGLDEETRRTLDGGWLHTGDVGYFDGDGYLVLADRLKDLIIWGGENISPKEVENVLRAHPAVLEAVVVGRPHFRYGEEPVAFVVLRGGAHCGPEELLAHCGERLARFKVPREIRIERRLPTNAVGKLVKGPLRERMRSESRTPSQ
ncbi:AMP-dependent synthetase [Actinomadura soli]|uniref:AMP-dependent synthetase n=1 Tax=Actinomadura soli TaxID=2508997 RepID=A0A5C4JHA4_9ACTN|nr:AMP-binding protein [Actinomadura soli]TMR05700.1 AMP-dependent synthetase [Actinomadura soli]